MIPIQYMAFIGFLPKSAFHFTQFLVTQVNNNTVKPFSLFSIISILFLVSHRPTRAGWHDLPAGLYSLSCLTQRNEMDYTLVNRIFLQS